VAVVAQMMIYLIFAACTFTCSIRYLWRSMLSPSSGGMNLVQVDAEVTGKGTVLIYKNVVKDFVQSEL
jgi:predicted permease